MYKIKKQKIRVMREFIVTNTETGESLSFDNVKDTSKYLSCSVATVYEAARECNTIKKKIINTDMMTISVQKYTVTFDKWHELDDDRFLLLEKYRGNTVESLENEEWRQIPGLHKANRISSLGRFKVVDDDGNEILKSNNRSTNSNGRIYHSIIPVQPDVKGTMKPARVSRLMAAAFLDSEFPIYKVSDEVVHHIDNDSTNDTLSNLRIASQKENIDAFYDDNPAEIKRRKNLGKNLGNTHGFKNIKPSRKVLCVETGIIYNSANDAARRLNAHVSSISNAARGHRQKSAYGYTWKYIED